MRHLLLAVTALLVSSAASAEAGGYGDRYSYPRVTQVPQGVGCYWYRGRLNCNRYCYWEVDGNRFCTRRLGEAESQAPEAFAIEDVAPYPPYRSPRRYK